MEQSEQSNNRSYCTTKVPLSLKLEKCSSLCRVFVYVLVTCGVLCLSECQNPRCQGETTHRACGCCCCSAAPAELRDTERRRGNKKVSP